MRKRLTLLLLGWHDKVSPNGTDIQPRSAKTGNPKERTRQGFSTRSTRGVLPATATVTFLPLLAGAAPRPSDAFARPPTRSAPSRLAVIASRENRVRAK